MADSRNKPEIETLSYEPKCRFCGADRKIEAKFGNWQFNCDCYSKAKFSELTNEDYEGCNPKQPASAPPTTMGFNSAVIKPETRLNKIEDAEQIVKCKGCGWSGAEGERNYESRCPKCNRIIPTELQPNQNLMIITEIEGLMSQVNEKLDNMKENTWMLSCHRPKLISQALEEIDLFQKTTLFDLRKAFE